MGSLPPVRTADSHAADLVVTYADINRLFAEANATGVNQYDQWLAQNPDVDESVLDTIKDLCEPVGKEALRVVKEEGLGDGLSKDQILLAMMQAFSVMWFMLGWEAHKQYGKGTDGEGDG